MTVYALYKNYVTKINIKLIYLASYSLAASDRHLVLSNEHQAVDVATAGLEVVRGIGTCRELSIVSSALY
jgi:hypothetical protein